MCKRIKIFSSLNRNENDQAKDILDTLQGVELEWIAPISLLEDDFELPSIFTDEGYRYHGLDSIKRFVDRELT